VPDVAHDRRCQVQPCPADFVLRNLEGPDSTSVVSFGWDPRLNKVVVQLSAPDPQATSYFREHIPDDALLFRLVPWRAVAL
jgi:hypothetical protein